MCYRDSLSDYGWWAEFHAELRRRSVVSVMKNVKPADNHDVPMHFSITSIDNMYEDDGISNLSMFLGGLNAEPARPLKNVLIAILPEYDDSGILQRLDCITVATQDIHAHASSNLEQLISAAKRIVTERKRAYAAAMAKLDEQPSIKVEK